MLGDTAQKKCILGGGDTAHTLLLGGTIGKEKGEEEIVNIHWSWGEQLGWGQCTTFKEQGTLGTLVDGSVID